MSLLNQLKATLASMKNQRRAIEVKRAKKSVLRGLDLMLELASDPEVRGVLATLAGKSVELGHREEDLAEKDNQDFSAVLQAESIANMELEVETIRQS